MNSIFLIALRDNWPFTAIWPRSLRDQHELNIFLNVRIILDIYTMVTLNVYINNVLIL